MTAPTGMQSRGYDIMIWADDSGRILAQSYTILGEVILHGLMPGHRMGEQVEIEEEPSVFFGDIPRKTSIGLLNPMTGIVTKVTLGGLH